MSDLPETPVSEQARHAGPVSSRELDPEEIPSTDIVFECPHCAKSLSIDQRGAGLVIRCTQCGEPVTVPIPEGMAIEDFDATPEELSAQLLNTRQTLSRAQRRIAELEAEVAAFAAFREETKRARTAAEEAATRAGRGVQADAALVLGKAVADDVVAGLRRLAADCADSGHGDSP